MRHGHSADFIQEAQEGEEMTPATIDARLQQIIADRCAGKITRQECVEEVRRLRALLSEKQLDLSESGSTWSQARPYVRLAAQPDHR